MKLARRAIALIAVTAVTTIGSAPALADGPKKGVYYCYDIGSNVRILAGNHYKINSAKGNKGSYAYKAAKKKIIFKTGDYRGFFGFLTGGGKTIDIHDAEGYLWSCSR